MKWPLTSLNAIFGNQTNKLICCGYPEALGLTEDAFRESLKELRSQLIRIADIEIPDTHLPFIIVITDEKIPLMKRLEIVNFQQWMEEPETGCQPNELKSLVEPPRSNYYIAVDVEIGEKTKIQYPEMGGITVTVHKRSPLTIDEGVALLTIKQDIVSFDRSLLLSGTRYCGHYYKNETPFITLFTGEFDYGFRIDHTMENTAFSTNRNGRKIWWGTPSCQFRIDADDFETTQLNLELQDILAIESIVADVSGLVIDVNRDGAIHLALKFYAKLMKWHGEGFEICENRGEQRSEMYLGVGPIVDENAEAFRDSRHQDKFTFSKSEQKFVEKMVETKFAQNRNQVVRRVIHGLESILEEIASGMYLTAEKTGEEPIMLDILTMLTE